MNHLVLPYETLKSNRRCMVPFSTMSGDHFIEIRSEPESNALGLIRSDTLYLPSIQVCWGPKAVGPALVRIRDSVVDVNRMDVNLTLREFEEVFETYEKDWKQFSLYEYNLRTLAWTSRDLRRTFLEVFDWISEWISNGGK